MKFTKAIRLSLAIFFIYLTAFVELSQIQSNRFFSGNKRFIKEKSHVPVINPLINFLTGTLEGLNGNRMSFDKCLPSAWKKPGVSGSLETQTLTSTFQNWNQGLQIFLNAPIIDFLCKMRETIVKLISGVVALVIKQRRKFRVMSFLESGSRSKKFSARFKRNQRALMTVSKSKVLWFWKNIVARSFKSWLAPLSEKVTSLVSEFPKFFDTSISTIIFRAFDCINTIRPAKEQIVTTIKSLKSKIDVLRRSKENKLLLVITVVDYITAFVCNREEFMKALEFLNQGFKANENSAKLLLFGKALGTLLLVIANTNTFGTDKYKEIQDQISNEKRKK